MVIVSYQLARTNRCVYDVLFKETTTLENKAVAYLFVYFYFCYLLYTPCAVTDRVLE